MSVIYPLPSKEQLRIIKACEKHDKMMMKKASERIMKELKKKEQDFTGFEEQDFPYKCPNCDEKLTLKDCIGVGEYPQGGLRASMKPNRIEALGFECPKCFTKSCFHADKYSIKTYEDFKTIQELNKD